MGKPEQAQTVLLVCADPLYPGLPVGGAARIFAMTDYLRSVGFRVEMAMPYFGRRIKRAVEARVDRLHLCGTRTERLMRGIQEVFPDALGGPIVRQLDRVVRKKKLAGRRKLVRGDLSSLILRKIDPELVALTREVTRRNPPTAVVAQFAWTARALDEVPAKVLKLVDTHDVQHLRRQRAQEAGGDLPSHVCTREEEVRELSRADVLMAIQREEVATLSDMCPGKPIILVEHAEGTVDPAPSPAGSKQVLFVGSNYDPNVLGMRRFIEGPWREIRRAVPDAELVICGTVCDALLEGGDGVRKMGRVPKLLPYYREAAVVINPVPYGSGLKIKSVEALSFGKCLVTTPSGVTGLEGDRDAAFHVCEIETMAGAIIPLLTDPSLRGAEERRVQRYASRRFAARNVYRELELLIRRGLPSNSRPVISAESSRRSSPARDAARPGEVARRS